MYRVDEQYFSPRDFSSSDGKPYRTYDRVKGVYSFRTGVTGGNPVVDVTIPDFTKMRPADRQRRLGEFYRDFSESSAALSTAAARENESRYLTGDTGHEFMSFDISHDPALVRESNAAGFSTVLPHYITGVPCMPSQESGSPWAKYLTYRQASPRGAFLNGDCFNSIGRLDPQSLLNYLFSTIRYDAKPVADIAETLGELVVGGPFALVNGLLGLFNGLLKTAGKTKLTTNELSYLLFSQNLRKKKLKEGARALKRSSHEAGATYLFAQFGVSPFVQDVIKAVNHLTQIHSIVYGTSERFHRRSALKTESFTLSSYANPSGAVAASSTGVLSRNLTVSSEVNVIRSYDTFLSARTSGLARPNSAQRAFLGKADALLYNLGFQEPDLLWDLTSFSWLLDWWLHLGTSIVNASRLSGNGKSVDYAYATTVVKTFATQRNTGLQRLGGGVTAEILKNQGKLLAVAKYRRRATPFGFGGDLSSLTSGQMSILTALGLAKTR